MPSSFLFSFFLAVFCSFLGGLSVTGANFAPEHRAAGIERAHLSKACDHFQAFPDALLRQLPHEAPSLIKLIDKLFDFVGFGAAAGSDAAATAHVDQVGIAPFFLGHGIDNALKAA